MREGGTSTMLPVLIQGVFSGEPFSFKRKKTQQPGFISSYFCFPWGTFETLYCYFSCFLFALWNNKSSKVHKYAFCKCIMLTKCCSDSCFCLRGMSKFTAGLNNGWKGEGEGGRELHQREGWKWNKKGLSDAPRKPKKHIARMWLSRGYKEKGWEMLLPNGQTLLLLLFSFHCQLFSSKALAC